MRSGLDQNPRCLLQSAQRPQNSALQSALRGDDLCDFKIQQMKSQKKTLSNGLPSTKINKLTKNTQAGNWENNLREVSVHLFVLLLPRSSQRQVGAGRRRRAFGLNHCSLSSHLMVGAEEEEEDSESITCECEEVVSLHVCASAMVQGSGRCLKAAI